MTLKSENAKFQRTGIRLECVHQMEGRARSNIIDKQIVVHQDRFQGKKNDLMNIPHSRNTRYLIKYGQICI